MRVLDHAAQIQTSSGDVVVNGAVKHPLIALLALHAPDFIPLSVVKAELWGMSAGAMDTHMYNLRKKSDLFETVRGSGYRLRAAPRSFDLRDFLEAADAALLSERPADAQAALRLWAGELRPGVAKTPTFVRASELRARLRELASRKPKHVLIVEDVLGYQIEQILISAHSGVTVEVADSIQQFDLVKHRLADFDLALVDFHLDNNDTTFSGLTVVAEQFRRLRTKTVPVLGMSYSRPSQKGDRDLALRYDLWGFVSKLSAGDDTTLDAIVESALLLLADDDQDRVGHYRSMLPDVRRKARGRLAQRGETHRSAAMERDLARLESLANEGRLNDLRFEFYAFQSAWTD